MNEAGRQLRGQMQARQKKLERNYSKAACKVVCTRIRKNMLRERASYMFSDLKTSGVLYRPLIITIYSFIL